MPGKKDEITFEGCEPSTLFREFATECMELAQTAPPEKKALYLKMASVWHQMAQRWKRKASPHPPWSLMLRNCKAKPLIATLMFCAVSATAAAAMDRGQFKNVPPEIREWFENMRSPKGIVCCSYADGHRTGYDIRQGQYWVPIEGEWYPVPPEAVIKTENPVGEAIVWYQGAPESYLPRSEWYRIICFVPLGDV